MAHDEGQSCKCSLNHQPGTLELVIHHVWPKGDGGPDDPANEVFICPTTHYNIHELLRAMVKEDRQISLYEFSERYDTAISRYAYKLAALGFRRIKAQAMID